MGNRMKVIQIFFSTITKICQVLVFMEDSIHGFMYYRMYRAYTKEWCGFKSYSLLIPHHSFVYALYYVSTRL
jgi:hypothetical protein